MIAAGLESRCVACFDPTDPTPSKDRGAFMWILEACRPKLFFATPETLPIDSEAQKTYHGLGV